MNPDQWSRPHCTLRAGCLLPSGHPGECSMPDEGADEDEYEVESILDERRTKRAVQYLLKWRGWPVEDSTWEGVSSLKNCKHILRDWKAQQKRRAAESTQHGHGSKSAVSDEQAAAKAQAASAAHIKASGAKIAPKPARGAAAATVDADGTIDIITAEQDAEPERRQAHVRKRQRGESSATQVVAVGQSTVGVPSKRPRGTSTCGAAAAKRLPKRGDPVRATMAAEAAAVKAAAVRAAAEWVARGAAVGQRAR